MARELSTKSGKSAQQIESVAWAIFFIWVGVTVLLAHVRWEWFILGIGVLILAAQLARWLMDMEIQGFWVACGVVFLAGRKRLERIIESQVAELRRNLPTEMFAAQVTRGEATLWRSPIPHPS